NWNWLGVSESLPFATRHINKSFALFSIPVSCEVILSGQRAKANGLVHPGNPARLLRPHHAAVRPGPRESRRRDTPVDHWSRRCPGPAGRGGSAMAKFSPGGSRCTTPRATETHQNGLPSLVGRHVARMTRQELHASETYQFR